MTAQSPNLIISQSANPYVGPRTFETADRQRYFGRETEATSLLGRVISERLLLFYAQSGAGKSLLINARLIPALREEEGFSVLPVARVAGALPAGVEQVDNIFLFNLMASLDRAARDPDQFARLGLTDFLDHLVTEDGVAWRYDPAAAADVEEAPPMAEEESDAAAAGRFALIVDQFEEIITGHPERWQEREEFFRQLDAALQANPNLWVFLSLREDYVAALDPYAPLVFNRLRARFYMERMGVDAALEAVRRPAELGDRPFAPGVAEQLVDNLRQVRVPGQEATVPGQYVEPVQLQVVCYQLWENLVGAHPGGQPEGQVQDLPIRGGAKITFEDLAVAGDVDQALTQFYEETLALALADPGAAGVSERQVRTWFDGELITEAGTRGLVHQGEAETAGLPNAVVRALQRRFLVRGETRGGDTWIELVHDRFVEPIRRSNHQWESRRRIRWQPRRSKVLWTDAKTQIEDGNIIPFISGTLVHEVIHRSGEFDINLKQLYVELSEYPLHDTDLDMLTEFRTATTSTDEGLSRPSLATKREYFDRLKQLLYQLAEEDSVDQSILEKALDEHYSMSASQFAELLGFPHFGDIYADSLMALTALPFPIYVTTSPLQILERALQLAGRIPHQEVFPWNRAIRDRLPQNQHTPSAAEPLVYHLFGVDELTDSVVLTRTDLLEFIAESGEWARHMSDVLPPAMERAFTTGSLLVLGYRHREWEFKAIAETIIRPYSGVRPLGVVQVQADKALTSAKRAEYLNAFYAEMGLKTYWGSTSELIGELRAISIGA